MKKGLTATQLELIAILLMICDHVAKLLLDINSPWALIMRIFGMITMPILCYLSVVEYRHQTNLVKYMLSLSVIWLISIFPYQMFYYKTIGIRQNLIFDILLGTVAIYVLELRGKQIFIKVVLFSIILLVSIHFSSSPLVSICLIVSYYYDDNYLSIKKNTIKITFTIFLLICLVEAMAVFGAFYVPAELWKINLTVLGYMLALPLIRSYNGLAGSYQSLRHILYIIYPLHFLAIKYLICMTAKELYHSYVYIHLLTIFLTWLLGYITLRAKISRAQISNVIVIMFSLFLMTGYYLEVTAKTQDVMWAATKVEYIGLLGMVIALTWFINEFCDRPLGNNIFLFEAVCTGVFLYCLFFEKAKGLFIHSIGIKRYPYHCVAIEKTGVMYYGFHVYLGIIWFVMYALCLKKKKSLSGSERKRAKTILWSLLIPEIVLIVRLVFPTEEYDIGVFAIFSFIVFFTTAIVRNDYLANLQTEGELDPLTGLSNRKFFIEKVQQKLVKHTKGTMVMMDMDNFKYINDNYGHGMGDKVLIALADAMKEVIRGSQYISRLGGDEFCAFLCNVIDKRELQQITDELLEKFQKNIELQENDLRPTISIGLAIYDGKNDETFETLYENADKALYVAKNSGKSQYKFYA